MTTASGFTLAVLFIKRASTFKITFFANANLRGFVYDYLPQQQNWQADPAVSRFADDVYRKLV
jgi:hypothetical protein